MREDSRAKVGIGVETRVVSRLKTGKETRRKEERTRNEAAGKHRAVWEWRVEGGGRGDEVG